MASIKTLAFTTLGVIVLLTCFWLVTMVSTIQPTWPASQVEALQLLLMFIGIIAPFVGMMQE